MLAWTPSLTIGVAEIDAQHRALFEQAANFEAAVKAREPCRLEELFGYLQVHARVHFEAEERLMLEVSYPRLNEHVREHSEFKRRLQSLVPHWEVEGDSSALLLALLGFLHFWLTDHVKNSDQRIEGYLRSKGFGPGLRGDPGAARRR